MPRVTKQQNTPRWEPELSRWRIIYPESNASSATNANTLYTVGGVVSVPVWNGVVVPVMTCMFTFCQDLWHRSGFRPTRTELFVRKCVQLTGCNRCVPNFDFGIYEDRYSSTFTVGTGAFIYLLHVSWNALEGDIERVKEKVKFTLEQPTKAHMGVEVQLFL